MKKILLVIMSLLLALSFFGCAQKEEQPVDETPLIDLVKSIEPSTLGFYSLGDSQNIDDYKDARFITISPIKTSEDEAIEDLKNLKRWDNLTIENITSVLDAINSLVAESDEKRVLLINNAYFDAIKSNELVGGLLDNMKCIYTYDSTIAYDYSLTDTPFQLAVFGSDNRASEIIDHSRYDTDMIITVNPTTKQVLIVSTPRDSYLPNAAHDNQYDKLTHLGDDGPENSMKGLNFLYDIDLKYYILTNFLEFVTLVDKLGGLDFYNPYTFRLDNGGTGTFYEGDIHVNGAQALSYARERFTLKDGDVDRCRHAVILVKAIISKLLAVENLARFNELMEQIKSCFQTNISMKQMYGLAVMEYIDRPDWNIVSYTIWADNYHLAPTATYSDQGYLNVGIPDSSDAEFVSQEMKKVLNGESITPQSLPSGH